MYLALVISMGCAALVVIIVGSFIKTVTTPSIKCICGCPLDEHKDFLLGGGCTCCNCRAFIKGWR
jgi:hypothetical protein